MLFTASMLLWFKPAGDFVRADFTVTERQKEEESSLLKTDSFNEDLSECITATKATAQKTQKLHECVFL